MASVRRDQACPELVTVDASRIQQTQLKAWLGPSSGESVAPLGKCLKVRMANTKQKEKEGQSPHWIRRREERRGYLGRGWIQGFAREEAERCSLEKLLPVKKPATCVLVPVSCAGHCLSKGAEHGLG